MAQGASRCRGTEGSFPTSLRIVCEIGDASPSKVHEARVEVCIRDCSSSYRAMSPKSFTFVVSPVPWDRAGPGRFGVGFQASWKTGHHFLGGEVGMLWAGVESCWLNFSKAATSLPSCGPAGTASPQHCALLLSHRSLSSAALSPSWGCLGLWVLVPSPCNTSDALFL